MAVVVFFAGLAMASGGKGKSSGDDASTTAAGSADGGANKLLGSCDRSHTFHLDCTEEYASIPSTVFDNAADKKKSCTGRFLTGHCPRINAITQCLQGNPGHLSGSYEYEGYTHAAKADECTRGYRDYRKNPDLKPSPLPASCNAVATGGTCTLFSAVTVDTEKSCLGDGGEMKQPPEPCPAANVLGNGIKLTAADGATTTEWFYTTPYANENGTKTWKADDVALLCGLAGDHCRAVPPPSASAPAASPATSAKGGVKAGPATTATAKGKPKAPPAKK